MAPASVAKSTNMHAVWRRNLCPASSPHLRNSSSSSSSRTPGGICPTHSVRPANSAGGRGIGPSLSTPAAPPSRPLASPRSRPLSRCCPRSRLPRPRGGGLPLSAATAAAAAAAGPSPGGMPGRAPGGPRMRGRPDRMADTADSAWGPSRKTSSRPGRRAGTLRRCSGAGTPPSRQHRRTSASSAALPTPATHTWLGGRCGRCGALGGNTSLGTNVSCKGEQPVAPRQGRASHIAS